MNFMWFFVFTVIARSLSDEAISNLKNNIQT